VEDMNRRGEMIIFIRPEQMHVTETEAREGNH
jgi:hypothetical protein